MSKRTKRKSTLTKDKKFIDGTNITWMRLSKLRHDYKRDKRKIKKVQVKIVETMGLSEKFFDNLYKDGVSAVKINGALECEIFSKSDLLKESKTNG